MTRSASHLVLIPSYNTGPRLLETVTVALAHWSPVWVVVDGSSDGSEKSLQALSEAECGLKVMHLPTNSGKGAAVLAGMGAAAQAKFTHALVMDADGQHPATSIPLFMRTAVEHPDAMVLGVPVFGTEAPASRRVGRRAGNWWANVETLWGGVQDSLFGFRVYPLAETLRVFQRIRGGRRFDFDTVAVVRLFWEGVRPINLEVPVRYFSRAEGGVSHFRYWRDNRLLISRHIAMVLAMIPRIPSIWRCRNRARSLARTVSAPKRQIGLE